MRPLFTLSARWVLRSCALILGVALLAALVRLLPWLVAKQVPLRVSFVFAELLAARGAEIAALVGVPVGTATAAALFVERGEARALAALGVRPLQVTMGLAPLGVAVVLSSIAVARLTESTSAARFAIELAGSGRAACAGSRAPRRVDLPLLSLSWLCFATGPRLVGTIPGRSGGLWFTGSALRGTSEERALVVDDLRLVGPGVGVSLHAGTARVSGLPGWPQVRRLSGVRRGMLSGFVAVATALTSAWTVLRRDTPWPIWAAAAAGTAAIATVALLRALDDARASAATYAVAVPVGALVALLLHAGTGPLLRSRIAGRKA